MEIEVKIDGALLSTINSMIKFSMVNLHKKRFGDIYVDKNGNRFTSEQVDDLCKFIHYDRHELVGK